MREKKNRVLLALDFLEKMETPGCHVAGASASSTVVRSCLEELSCTSLKGTGQSCQIE